MNGVVIKKATVKDVALISIFMSEQANDERKFLGNLDKKGKFSFYSAKEIKKILSSPHCCLLIAQLNGKPIGCGLAKIEKTEGWVKYRRRGHLGMLYVHKKYRRKGVAKRLQEERINWLQSKGINLVSCMILASNTPSLNLSAERGFKPHAIYLYNEIR